MSCQHPNVVLDPDTLHYIGSTADQAGRAVCRECGESLLAVLGWDAGEPSVHRRDEPGGWTFSQRGAR